MRRRYRKLIHRMILAGAALVGCGPTALAQTAEKPAAEANPGMYVRFDGGWAVGGGARIKDNDASNATICKDSTCGTPGKLNEVGSGYVAGAGVGYRFTSMFRSDAVLTYRGSLGLNDHDGAGSTFKGNISAWSTMVNGYVDIPITFGRFHPYVGLGLGLSRVETGSIDMTTRTRGTMTSPGGVKYSPSWAIMLGTGVNIFESLYLDLGYRYAGIGKIAINGGATSNGANYSGAKGNLSAHEWMTGLRYEF